MDISGITFIMYVQSQKIGNTNNSKVFGSKKTKCKQGSQIWLRSPIPEGMIITENNTYHIKAPGWENPFRRTSYKESSDQYIIPLNRQHINNNIISVKMRKESLHSDIH